MRNVVILGMHRSGTSMVAGALASAGLYAGEMADLLADQHDNPHGFWERSDVVALNDRVLANAGGSWYQPPAAIGAESTQYFAEADGIVSRLSADGGWLLKDPRMVITWPVWEASLDDAVLLYVYRNPLSVAVSLQRRNGFPLSLGIALWEWYNQRAIDALQGREVICVAFESIAENPGAAMSTVLETLSDFGVRCSPGVDGSLYDSALGTSRADNEELAEALLSENQQQLAAYCEALCTGETLPDRPPLTRKFWAQLQDLGSALAPLARVKETNNELIEATRLCRERTAERDRTLERLHQQELEHTDLARAHRDEVERHENLQEQYVAILATVDQLKETVDLFKRKGEALFVELSSAYGKVLSFEQSFLGRLERFVTRCYKLVTFRRGTRTGYDDVLLDARGHFEKHELALPVPARPPGKASMLRDVVSYVARNPAGSARSFSLPRLKRAAAVFMKSSPEDLGVWIDSRFPDRQEEKALSPEYQLDESLDTLRLTFPPVESPLVSIVIPVYNEYRVTLRCLRSILEHTPDMDYEVIIGDDCSTDLTASIDQRVENITVVRGEQNQRFLGNCNQAAAAARGEHILFLNNDTAVCPNWLSPLVELLERDPQVGVTGSKLLFPDGRLQEAGGILWRDASAWNYGRMDDPDKPEYNYLKEVDYISGACLLIRAQLWQQLGGFDERYRPAYYEDADIAFEARAAGYKVVYQPLSQVFHFEGVSNGTDLASGIKKYQVDNQHKFRDKWASQLDSFHFPNAENVFQARDRSRGQRCVLFIDHYVPHYDKDAGSRSTFMYVQLMLEMGYRVLFLGANYFPHRPYTQTLQQMGVEVLVGESMARNQDRWLRDNAPYIDCIYLHRPHIAEQLLSSLHKMKPRPRIVFFGHDLHYLRIEREYAVTGDASLSKDADNWRKREFAVFDRVDKVYYPSQVEIDEIRKVRSDLDLRAIPLYAFDSVEAPQYNIQGRSDLLFVGGFNHPPNVDAVCWFVESVLPLVSRQCPGIRLHVVGSNPTDTVEDLQSEQVIVYGYLSDEELDALYGKLRLAVVPLRFGAGVKGKVLEAVQKNLPLVTTSVGAEGIPDAEAVMAIADTAEDFALAVQQNYEGGPQVLDRLRQYPEWLERNFSKDNATRILLEDFGSPLRGDDSVSKQH